MRTLCLTLPETPERTDGARKHFADMGLMRLRPEFFHGICAKSFGLFTTHPYLVDDPKRGGSIIPQRQVGCMLSHYMLWSALNLIQDEGIFLVLEDDAEFPADWDARFWEALNNVPEDADMLFIGSCCTADKPKTPVKGDVWEVKWPLATHAYVVWRKALPALLATQRDVYAPVDLALYFKTLPQLRVYTVLPRIVAQRGTELSP